MNSGYPLALAAGLDGALLTAIDQPSHKGNDMETTEVREARLYYELCFGPDSDRAMRHDALLLAEQRDDDPTIEALRAAEAESVLSVEQLTHSFRGNDTWEILLTSAGPSARVIVEVNDDGEVVEADFQYRGVTTPWWMSPRGQDAELIIDWADANFGTLLCRYCEEERR